MTSEDLLQTASKSLGRYQYYKLGNTTLRQLRAHKIFNTPAPRKLATKKPDGIVFEPDGEVAAVVEFKPPSELATQMAVAKAVSQELEVARFLGKLLVVTSGETTFWINALNGERVLSDDGNELRYPFNVLSIEQQSLSDAENIELAGLIEKCNEVLTEATIALRPPRFSIRHLWRMRFGKEFG